jgi:HSP20 family molecular chaperone IbpA
VTVRQRAVGSGTGSDRESLHEAEEHLQQTFTLPAGTEPAAIETRFEDGMLRIRVSLRKARTP